MISVITRLLLLLLAAVVLHSKRTDAQTQLYHVPNNTALKGAATADYAVLIRDGFITAGDAPPLMYVASDSPCSRGVGGAGDNGAQVKSADGKCWVANFPAEGADVREWGAKCDFNGMTGTDDTAALNAALSAVPRAIVPNKTCYSATGITVPQGGDLVGTNFLPMTPPQGSIIECPHTSGMICVTIDGGASHLGAARIENISVVGAGTLSVGDNSIGVRWNTGYGPRATNLKMYNWDVCGNWFATNNGGLSFHGDNIRSGMCGTHYWVFDGWAEAHFDGGRLGEDGDVDFAARDFIAFVNSACNGGGCGPNTITLQGTQINPGNSATPACAFNFQYDGAIFTGKIDNGSGSAGNTLTVTSVAGGVILTNTTGDGATINGAAWSGTPLAPTKIANQLTGTTGGVGTYAVGGAPQLLAAGTYSTTNPGVVTEFRFEGVHHEVNSATPRPMFCSDRTFTKISQLYMSNSQFANTYPVNNEVFQLDLATELAWWHVNNSELGGQSTITLKQTPSQIGATRPAYQHVQFHGINGVGAWNLTANGVGGNQLEISDSYVGSLTIAGAWDGRLSLLGNRVNTVADTAVGNVYFDEPPQSWSPVLGFGSPPLNTGWTARNSGTYARTADGGFTANYNVTVTGVGSATGSAAITGLPLLCKTPITSPVMPVTVARLAASLAAPPMAEFDPTTHNQLDLVYWGGPSYSALTNPQFASTAVRLVGSAHCTQAQ